jgi:hypothetical protein
MRVWFIIGGLLLGCGTKATKGPQPEASTAPPATAPAKAPVAAPTAPAVAATSRLITASGVRLRQTASTDGAEVARLSIGTVVTELARSPTKVKVGAQEDHWYEVRTSAGQQGWVFGAVTQPVDAAGRDAARVALAEQRLKVAEAPFPDRVDLYNMLVSAVAEAGPAAKPELELLRLLSVRYALDAREVSGQQAPGVDAWAKGLEPLVFHDEISASWLVRADEVWKLHEQHKATPVADRIAWEAAQTPFGGECEGDATCTLGSLDMAEGRYLRASPKGAYVAQALTAIAETAGQPYIVQNAAETPAEYRGDLKKVVTALTAAVAATEPSPAKEKATAALAAIGAKAR